MTLTLAPHEEQFIRRKIWIISLGHRGAARWARAHGLTANQWRHVNIPDDLQGVRDAQILWIGPVWERHDFQRLCDIVDDGVAAGDQHLSADLDHPPELYQFRRE
jgi:hypothetical protein